MTSTIDTMENGVVMFKGVTGEEAGGYICTATNDMGSVSATATLIIQGIKIFSTIEFCYC
jgi:hypothetical protein